MNDALKQLLEDRFLNDWWCETSTGFDNMQDAINEIVNEFRNQIRCRNCKYFLEGIISSTCDIGISEEIIDEYNTYYADVSKDFGCNRFEIKLDPTE